MSKQVIVPKIKKREILTKVMMEPYNIGKPLNPAQLPELTNDSLILSMVPQKMPLAKLNPQGSLKMHLKYVAELITLVDRYVEVEVIDEYNDLWVGILFGKNVKGKGGQGPIRGCKVVQIEDQSIRVEAMNEGGNELWKNLEKRINDILSKNN